MLTKSFNIIVEKDKFYGIMDAVDYYGNPLILYNKTLTKENVEYFIYNVKISESPSAHEKAMRINSPNTRLRVCRILLANNIKYTKDIVKEYIDHCNQYIEDKMEEKRNSEDEFSRAYIQDNIEEMVRIKEEWKKTLQAFTKKHNDKTKITEQDIQMAKEFPIIHILNINRDGFTKCIFHTEKSPSMKYYPASNSVHCFGCNQSADSIKVAQQYYGDNFINAVKRLTGK